MDYLSKLVGDIECHDVNGIKECFDHGISPNDSYNGTPLIYELTSEYTRTPNFKHCIQAFIDHGLEFEDKVLLAVLTDDYAALQKELLNDAELVSRRYDLRCAYTPLHQVTLLHICSEFNHVSCAQQLVEFGAAINAKAGIDEFGFGGQTPIFHTVNQNINNSLDMLNYLLSQSTDLTITVTGLIWGKSYPWETLIPSVNPISYSMMGLLPQMHRNEHIISKVVSKLLHAAYGIDYIPSNIPNEYLKKG
ncbi:MAG: ankyrin repeat domain-containing protein [Saprospiraceae bacterium]